MVQAIINWVYYLALGSTGPSLSTFMSFSRLVTVSHLTVRKSLPAHCTSSVRPRSSHQHTVQSALQAFNHRKKMHCSAGEMVKRHASPVSHPLSTYQHLWPAQPALMAHWHCVVSELEALKWFLDLLYQGPWQ